MTRSRALRFLVRICRFGLAVFFIVTAAAKLANAKAFAVNVGELLNASGINQARWVWPVAIGVISAELIIALLLILGGTVRLGALCAAALLVGFACYALYYVYILHGEPLECGCFGAIIASQLGVKTALRNLGLLIPAIVVFVGCARLKRDQTERLPHPITI